MHSLMRFVLGGLVVLFPCRTLLAAPATDVTVDAHGNATVDVVSELTEAGKKIERPTPEHPAYYVPISGGYHPGGQLNFWNRAPPSEAQVLGDLAKDLAQQGYLLATREHHPSLILVVWWGYKAAIPIPDAYALYISRRPPRPRTIDITDLANKKEMLTLTGGARSLNTWAETDRGPALNEAVEAAGVPRYYTTIVAADYSDWSHHKYTQLWVAHVSAPYWGSYLGQALPVFFKTGAPMFGRDMSAPEMVITSVVPKGHVIVGTPVLKTDTPGSATPAPAP
jgi:hypothetical protein